MSPPAQSGTTQTEPRNLGRAINQMPSMAPPCPQPDYHPDVLAVARQAGITRDRDLRHLQRLHDRYVASADADWDFGAQVLTFMRRRQSIPVDTTTGERAAKRLDKQRSYR